MSNNESMPAAKPTPTAPLTETGLGQVIGYQLAQATISTMLVFNRQVGKPFDLRPVEYTILSLIHQNPDGSAAQLAKALAVTAPNITMWIDRLEERGFVQRMRSETDKRAQHLRLTAAGQEIVVQATERVLAGERAAFAQLSDGERMMLLELLTKVARSRPAKDGTAEPV